MSKKKLLTSITALALAATMLLGGTFAWQSINQSVVNEGSDKVNPGGRLHDDFDGENKNVYVENFATQPIYTRIRLEEYFKVAVNKGHGYKEAEDVVGSATTTDDVTTFDYRVFTEYDQQKTDDSGIITTVSACREGEGDDMISYFQWTMGSEASDTDDPACYMPTFNKNKDSLVADINGYYKETGKISSKDSDQYVDMVEYTEGQELESTAIYDADEDTIDEVGKNFDRLQEYVDSKDILTQTEKHTAELIPTTSGLISMEKWLEKYDAAVEAAGGGDVDMSGLNNYWVYDSDGWVYWSAPIAAASATGRLLDKIEMTQVMDDGWYYGLNVVAQFITAGDMGQKDNTGFYDTAKGEMPSSDALKLLEAIGVDTAGAENVLLLRQISNGGAATVALDGEDGDGDGAAAEDTALPSITVDEGTTITLLLENESNWLTSYSAEGDGANSAVSCFTIGDIEGKTLSAEVRTATAEYEEYQFGDYATLCLDYAKNKMTARMAKSAEINVADHGRTWGGEVTVDAPKA